MTERLNSITTQIATPIQAAIQSSISASDARPIVESADEEPYTIKCICAYRDDDGNTIYCETCDTWQHIECFYPGRVADASKAEFDHSCAECKPRPLDGDNATERQRLQRQNKALNDSPDKKSKRPPSKSHKKKPKPSDLQVNGHHDHDHHKHGSPHDHQPHTKKSKGHRSTQSISSQMKRSPPINSRPHNHAHPPSPVQTPPDLPGIFPFYDVSDLFLTLYDDDDSIELSSANSFANLTVSNSMGLWLRDPKVLREETGLKDDDVFQHLKPDVALNWPVLRMARKEMPTNNNSKAQVRYLTSPKNLSGPAQIGELNGHVGFQKDYCQDTENRWTETVHPRPFVFFHPQFPLFIDTRREGSISRYVRRSCRPNTNLETYIAHGSEYHFWLVSEGGTAANEPITLSWDFRFPTEVRSRYLRLLNLVDEDASFSDSGNITDEEYDLLTQIIQIVLADHGGCACELGTDCAFAKFLLTYQSRSYPQINGVKPKKGRKPKHSHVSPTSTGHATNSRAASEGQGDQYDEDDNRSHSGSIRSKPQSRDLTPSHSVEFNGILAESSEREKRKIAAVEEVFRKAEQPPRKKKRASDGSSISLASHSAAAHSTPKPRQRSIAPRASISHASTQNGNGPRSRQYVDASTASRRQSGSPFSAISPTGVPTEDTRASRAGSIPVRSRHPSSTPKPTYTDSAVQTDEVENAWWNACTLKPKRSILSLSKRLLNNRHNIRRKQEIQAAQRAASTNGDGGSARESPCVSMDLDHSTVGERHTASPTETKARNMSIASSTPSVDAPGSVDITMTEAPSIAISNGFKPPLPPWPTNTVPITIHKSPDLRVQMPTSPNFPTANMSAPLSGTSTITPSSASATSAQSPFGTGQFPPPSTVNGIAPSPVKMTKKLSLSDYKAARAKKSDTSNAAKSASGSSPLIPPAVLRPSLSTIEEAKAAGFLEGSALVDSPAAEKKENPLGAVSLIPQDTRAPLSEKPNGTL